MKKLLLIVNPNAGKNGCRNILSDILFVFHQNGFEPTVFFTEDHGDAACAAREKGPLYDRVVCMGGDGTLSETVSGLMALQPAERPELGYIPMGTTNDSAQSLGLDRNPRKSVHTAAEECPRPIDVGRFNNGYFFYVAAFGAFTEVSYETPQGEKKALGRLAYYLEAARCLPKLTSHWCRVETDEETLEGDFIFGAVSNSKSVGGVIHLKESEGVSLSDGIFEVLLIKNPENPLQIGPTITNIVGHNFNGGRVMLLRCRQAKFTFREPVAWTLDGEEGGLQEEAVCSTLPHAVSIAAGGAEGDLQDPD